MNWRALLLAGLAVLVGCSSHDAGVVTLRVWGLGREGEILRTLLPEFERRNPGIKVTVQQIPWTAAHEKLLTAFVGGATPDVAQLGNTWVPELVALGALDSLDPPLVDARDYFPGIWNTNVIDGRLYGVPWYVDTRLIFYRTNVLAAAGYRTFPTTWETWRQSMVKARAAGGDIRFAILLPLNEWAAPIIFGMELRAPLLRDHGRYGDFTSPEFRQAFAFYVGLFRDGLAPAVTAAQIANRYQSFGRGEYVMAMTGPWDIGEFDRRLPPSLNGKWMTAPMPSPGSGPGLSLAGGSSLVIFRGSRHQAAARQLIQYLSEPAVQVQLYSLTGDLPPRESAWADPVLDTNHFAAPFREQLRHVVPTPQVPEWEQIATAVAQYAEETVRGAMTEDAALTALDRDVDRMLEKRRWLEDHHR